MLCLNLFWYQVQSYRFSTTTTCLKVSLNQTVLWAISFLPRTNPSGKHELSYGTAGWSFGASSCSRISTSAMPCLVARECKCLHTGTKVLLRSWVEIAIKLKSDSKRHGTPLGSNLPELTILYSKVPVLKPQSSWECTVNFSSVSLPNQTANDASTTMVGLPCRPAKVAFLGKVLQGSLPTEWLA